MATGKSVRSDTKHREPSPTNGRELRRQGKRTMAKLMDAGMRVLAERGYHAARVDDVVRLAKVSHGTFYLYFSNKEDLFRALAVQCADEMTELAAVLGDVPVDDTGVDELRRWLLEFVDHVPQVRRRDPGVDGGSSHESRVGPARKPHVQRHHRSRS